MRTHPLRSEIWLTDLGMVGKIRPTLIISADLDDSDRDIVCIVPRTTKVRGTRFEVAHQGRGFEPGAFDAQGLLNVPTTRCLRRVGVVDGPTMARVENALRSWLGLA